MKDAIEVVVLVQWKNEAMARDVMKMMGERAARPAKGKPAVIASELKARAAYLRSRPMAPDEGFQQQEREILIDLDTLEIRARMLEVERRLGARGPTYRDSLAQVEELAFAVRGRFVAFVEAMNEPWTIRAAATDPKRRAEELAAIERFLAAKAAGTQATGTDGQ